MGDQDICKMDRYEESCYKCGSYDCVCDDGDYYQEQEKQEEYEQVCGYGHLYYGTHCDECVRGGDEEDDDYREENDDGEECVYCGNTVLIDGKKTMEHKKCTFMDCNNLVCSNCYREQELRHGRCVMHF